MSQESDLLYAVLALQMNFISKDQLVECGALWASDRKKSLPSILDGKGYLKPSARTALDAMVQAQMEAFGDPGRSLAALPVDDDVRRSLLDLPLSDKVRGTLMEFRPGASRPAPQDATETIVMTRTREERYRLGAEIGRGGLGRVVAARDTVLERDVAIKEMLSGADFRRDAQEVPAGRRGGGKAISPECHPRPRHRSAGGRWGKDAVLRDDTHRGA